MKALLVGGTGPTGPAIVAGLESRGHDVTICHTGSHELAEVEHLRHIHTDVRDHDALAATIGAESWDVAIVNVRVGGLGLVVVFFKEKLTHGVTPVPPEAFGSARLWLQLFVPE